MASAADDFIEVAGTLIVFAIPVIFLLIAVGPFIYLWRKKRLNWKNSVTTLIIVVAVEALYLYGLYWGFEILGSIAVMELYGTY